MSPFFASRTKTSGLSVALFNSTAAISVPAPANPAPPVHLRRATQALRILHARIFFRRAMRLANLAALIQVRKIPPCRRGTRVRARMHDARVERAGLPRRASSESEARTSAVSTRTSASRNARLSSRQHALCPLQK